MLPRQLAGNIVPVLFVVLVVVVDVALMLELRRVWLPGNDAVSWWLLDLDDPYSSARTSLIIPGAFRYAPPIALMFAPFGLLPWPVFLGVFIAIQLAALWSMSPTHWPYLVLFPPVLFNLYVGNIDTLAGAAILAGFRWPAAWAFVLLTKVTPGVGLLWFAFRREWRQLALALVTTAAIVAATYAVVPQLWHAWIDALFAQSAIPWPTTAPLPLRILLAVCIVFVAALTNRRWLVPVACLAALPNVWTMAWSMLAASLAMLLPALGFPGLRRWRRA